MTSIAELARHWSRQSEKRAPVHEITPARFWQKIDQSGGADACWPWLGAVREGGYGQYRNRRPHRIAYVLLVGPIPESKVLDHLCRNRLCCNPAHLEPVTIGENVLRGISHPASNAKKTHCKRGHLLDGDNLLIVRTPGVPPYRACRACKTWHNHNRVWRKS